MAGKKTEKARAVATAALELAAEKSWRNVSLHDIALRTNVSLSELYKEYLSREAILDGFVRSIDAEVLEGLEEEMGARIPARSAVRPAHAALRCAPSP